MSPIDALSSSAGGGVRNPHQGVKRATPGPPTAVPGALPAFRGRSVGPAEAVKVPKLSQGNRPNEGSNITIPYNRVTPIEFLSSWTGRVAPGDVAFVLKYPPGFLSSFANGNNATLGGGQTMTRVIGMDGLNRLLAGNMANQFKVKENVYIGPHPSDALAATNSNRRFNLTMLEDFRVDGIIKSNDQPYSFQSNGNRDAVVFNIAVQGPALTNNGYLLYEAPDKPRSGVARTVECYPRGSTEAGYHTQASGNVGNVGTHYLPHGLHDYVATITGTYAAYPNQMFDRHAQVSDTLYIGLRAKKIAHTEEEEHPHHILRKSIIGEDNQPVDLSEDQDAWIFEYVPFSSRKAWQFNELQTRLETANTEDQRDKVIKDFNMEPRRRPLTQKHAFDEDPFDSARSEDFEHMIGAWRIGRIMDSRAIKYNAYEGGPMDTSFGMMVDVNVEWMPLRPDTRSGNLEKDRSYVTMIRKLTNYNRTRSVETDRDNFWRKFDLGIDTANALTPSLQTIFGGYMGIQVDRDAAKDFDYSEALSKFKTESFPAFVSSALEGAEAREAQDDYDVARLGRLCIKVEEGHQRLVYLNADYLTDLVNKMLAFASGNDIDPTHDADAKELYVAFMQDVAAAIEPTVERMRDHLADKPTDKRTRNAARRKQMKNVLIAAGMDPKRGWVRRSWFGEELNKLLKTSRSVLVSTMRKMADGMKKRTPRPFATSKGNVSTTTMLVGAGLGALGVEFDPSAHVVDYQWSDDEFEWIDAEGGGWEPPQSSTSASAAARIGADNPTTTTQARAPALAQEEGTKAQAASFGVRDEPTVAVAASAQARAPALAQEEGAKAQAASFGVRDEPTVAVAASAQAQAEPQEEIAPGGSMASAGLAPPMRRRERAQRTSAVASVFDSIFGDPEGGGELADGAPASPARDSNSDTSGPVSFKRR